MNENEQPDIRKLAPGSVIHADSLLMRTRFGNWVSDGGFIVTDDELASDLAACFWDVLYDSGAVSS